MSGPTQAQIATVQQNLKNMQALNDYIYSHGQAKILNAYLLMTEKDNTDPGLASVLGLLASILGGITSAAAGPIGSIVGGFSSGMMNFWAKQKAPPSLNGIFASYITRFSATTQAYDKTLANYYQDVPGNWNVSFEHEGKTFSLADLSKGNFPAETNPEFENIAAAALLTLDKALWAEMLKAGFNVFYDRVIGQPFIMHGDKNKPPIEWAKKFYKKNPSFYIKWHWHTKLACNDTEGWEIDEWSLARGSITSQTQLSKDACTYLFQDSIDGTIINSEGLYPRKTVFFGLGIKTISPRGYPGDYVSKELSTGFLRAAKEGRTIVALINKVGRKELTRQITEQVRKDDLFAHNLARRPRETLEEFLDVRIPEVVDINVIIETPSSFGLVIPMDEN